MILYYSSIILSVAAALRIIVFWSQRVNRQRQLYLRIKESLKPEMILLKKKYQLKNSLQDWAFLLLQNTSVPIERFELLKIMFFYAEYFQFTQSGLCKTLVYLFWSLFRSTAVDTPNIEWYVYRSYVIYEHIVRINELEENLINISGSTINTSEYASAIRDIVKNITQELTRLQKDWKIFTEYSPIRPYQQLFLRAENKVSEKDFQKEIGNFLSDSIGEIEAALKSQLKDLAVLLDQSKTPSQTQSSLHEKVFDSHLVRLDLLTQSIERITRIDS